MKSNPKILITSLLVILVDQGSKILVKKYMALEQSQQVIGNFLRFTYIENPGIAFGLKVSSKGFFTFVSILASVAIVVYLFRSKEDKFLTRFPLALILGGAIGNLIDRILYGRVVDFVDVDFPDFLMERWPVFNVADVAVTIGMIILLSMILFEKGKKEEEV